MTSLAIDDIRAREEATKKIEADALRYEGRHPDQVAARAADERQHAATGRGQLRQRALAEATRRGYSFVPPKVPGDGWASERIRAMLSARFGYAQDLFVALVEAEERTKAAKRALAGDDRAGLHHDHAGLSDLSTERGRLDTLEARFEAALEELATWRSKVAEPGWLELLERTNAIEAPFEGYLVPNMPEEQTIIAAFTAFTEAVAAVSARQQAATAKNSEAVRSAMTLGIPSRELPVMLELLSMAPAQNFVREAAAHAWFETARRILPAHARLDDWLPHKARDDYRPMPSNLSEVRPVVDAHVRGGAR